MALGKYTIEAREERFAGLIASGYTYSDAFRATNAKAHSMPDEQIRQHASQWANRPNVVSIVRSRLNEAKLATIESIQAWFAKGIALREEARQAGNYNAAQGFHRQIGQANGALQDKLTITGPEQSDESLIAQLSKGDATVAAMLSKMIGKDSFDH